MVRFNFVVKILFLFFLTSSSVIKEQEALEIIWRDLFCTTKVCAFCVDLKIDSKFFFY